MINRKQHYQFGHVSLRKFFFSSPVACAMAMKLEDQNGLKIIWGHAGEGIEKVEPGADLSFPDGLMSVTVLEFNPRARVTIVAMPPPERNTEAHFVGLMRILLEDNGLCQPGHARLMARYITLERGIYGGESSTVLGEWDGRGNHLNLGPGPEATVEAFTAKLAEMVADLQAESGGEGSAGILPVLGRE